MKGKKYRQTLEIDIDLLKNCRVPITRTELIKKAGIEDPYFSKHVFDLVFKRLITLSDSDGRFVLTGDGCLALKKWNEFVYYYDKKLVAV